jgi:dihydroneopterin aldolase
VTDCVFVRGLEFEGNHGYTAAERRGTRRFRVNLTLELPLTAAAASDRIADTVEYWKVSEVVVGLGTRRSSCSRHSRERSATRSRSCIRARRS